MTIYDLVTKKITKYLKKTALLHKEGKQGKNDSGWHNKSTPT